jgi:hypothetical protein
MWDRTQLSDPMLDKPVKQKLFDMGLDRMNQSHVGQPRTTPSERLIWHSIGQFCPMPRRTSPLDGFFLAVQGMQIRGCSYFWSKKHQIWSPMEPIWIKSVQVIRISMSTWLKNQEVYQQITFNTILILIYIRNFERKLGIYFDKKIQQIVRVKGCAALLKSHKK